MFVENKNDEGFSSTFETLPLLPASRFKRWLASFINGVILWLMVAIGFMFGDFSGILSVILYVGLQLYFMKTYGQTIAKRWLGLRVCNYNTRCPVEFGQYVGREVIDFLFAWISFLIIISGIVALVRDDRRSLTDLLVGTVVLKDGR